MARRGIIGGVTRLLGGPGVAVAIAAAASAAPLASDEFVATATTLSADSGGTALGEVTPATPVTVAATRADAAQVAIEGWSMHDAPQYLYPAIGQRIVLVTLDAAGQAARTIERSQDDKYGIHWDEVKIVGWVPGEPHRRSVHGLAGGADALPGPLQRLPRAAPADRVHRQPVAKHPEDHDHACRAGAQRGRTGDEIPADARQGAWCRWRPGAEDGGDGGRALAETIDATTIQGRIAAPEHNSKTALGKDRR